MNNDLSKKEEKQKSVENFDEEFSKIDLELKRENSKILFMSVSKKFLLILMDNMELFLYDSKTLKQIKNSFSILHLDSLERKNLEFKNMER